MRNDHPYLDPDLLIRRNPGRTYAERVKSVFMVYSTKAHARKVRQSR